VELTSQKSEEVEDNDSVVDVTSNKEASDASMVEENEESEIEAEESAEQESDSKPNSEQESESEERSSDEESEESELSAIEEEPQLPKSSHQIGAQFKP